MMSIARMFRLIFPIGLAISILPSAFAETRLSGTAQAMRLETRDATVAEALAALGTTVGLHYSTASPALNRRVSGVYVGTLGHVVSRLLEGSNFVLKTSAQGVEIVAILDTGALPAQNLGAFPGVPSPGAPAAQRNPPPGNPPQGEADIERNPVTGAPLPLWLRAARPQPN